MMKWGKKKMKKNKQVQEHSSSSSTFCLSRVLPLSWISKLTQVSSKPNSLQPIEPSCNTTKPKPNTKASHGCSASIHLSVTPQVLDRIAARCPPEPSDAPRRLSVGNDETSIARPREIHERVVSRSARHNSLGEIELRPVRNFVVSERHPRAWPVVLNAPSETEQSDFEPAPSRRRSPRQRRRQQWRSIRANGKASEETETSPPRLSGARRSFKIRSKPKYKACSPRLVATRRREEGLVRFAVVKRTRDPQREFRESMEEMIGEKGMVGRPEELESLLACYLALNSDEHHDIIVKIFRQLWFDLERQRFDPKCPCSHRFD